MFNKVNVVSIFIDRAAKLKTGPLAIGQKRKRQDPTPECEICGPESRTQELRLPDKNKVFRIFRQITKGRGVWCSQQFDQLFRADGGSQRVWVVIIMWN